MDIMSALADPVRRSILETLNGRPLTAGEIAGRFPISRPAISRHLRILLEAGLVSVSASGRTRTYRFEPAPLAELDAWLAQYRDLWASRFDALETEVFRTRRERERREQQRTGRLMSPVNSIVGSQADDQKEQPA
jgi:DNA-binding transcriptional ArsR family regulator